jgi:hypothetical protein
MTERDIAGNVVVLVDVFRMMLVGSYDRKSTEDKNEIERVFVTALHNAVTTTLVDLHRCADALEHIAMVNSDRFQRELNR